MEDTRKFHWWSIRREEEEFILGRGPRTDFDPLLNYAVDNPVPQRSCPTIDEVLTKAQFLSPLLYQIHCIGLVGFGFAHIYSERHPLPNRDPTILFINWRVINYKKQIFINFIYRVMKFINIFPQKKNNKDVKFINHILYHINL